MESDVLSVGGTTVSTVGSTRRPRFSSRRLRLAAAAAVADVDETPLCANTDDDEEEADGLEDEEDGLST